MVVLLVLAACAPRGPAPLSPAQLQSRASRAIPADFDEVFDAAWLTLEASGWKVLEHDRRAGTLVTDVVVGASGLGRGWAADVSQAGATVSLTLLPRVFQNDQELTPQMHWTLEGPGGELERWDALFGPIAALTDAWKSHPELVLSNSRGEVDAVGVRLLVPGWARFDFSTDRWTMVMRGAAKGVTSALMYRIERRRPLADPAPVVHEVLELALHAPGKVIAPSDWQVANDAWGHTGFGEVMVGAQLTPTAVHWRRWEAGDNAWLLRVVAVCPDGDEACEADVRRVVESAVSTAPVRDQFR